VTRQLRIDEYICARKLLKAREGIIESSKLNDPELIQGKEQFMFSPAVWKDLLS
jgi:hypothetical protein